MKTLGLCIGIVVCLCLIFMTAQIDQQTNWKLKFCEIAEFSPDFTPQEKADCRIMRSKK